MSLNRSLFALHFAAAFLRLATVSAAVAPAGLLFCLAGCRPAPLQYYQVASSSMAPALLGPSLRATCQHCSHVFPVAAESYRAELVTRCSKCGGHCQVADQPLPGQRVAIAPLPAKHPLKRFELVAFQDQTSGAVHVKRLWGLPGEAITLRDGEVYIASPAASVPQLLQKSLAQLQQLCVPISNFPDDPLSHWYVTAAGAVTPQQKPQQQPQHRIEDFVHSASKAAGPLVLAPSQRLQWRHQRPAPVHTEASRSDAVPPSQWLTPSPISDDYEVNQGVSCQLYQVEDYLLQLELLTPLAGELQILWRRGESLLSIAFQQHDNHSGGHPRATTTEFQPPTPLRFTAGQQIVVAWCDRRLLIATDCERAEVDADAIAAALRPIAAADITAADTSWQLQVQATEQLQLTRLRVARDLYFPAWRPTNADADGYFVMGDNLPVSSDSRGRLGRIAPPQLVGRVKR